MLLAEALMHVQHEVVEMQPLELCMRGERSSDSGRASMRRGLRKVPFSGDRVKGKGHMCSGSRATSWPDC